MSEWISGVLDWIPLRARLPLKVIASLVALAVGSISGYTQLVAAANRRIDRRMHPMKVKMYENSAILDHVFDAMETAVHGEQRHDKDAIRREARDQMHRDEAIEKVEEEP
jgi:hypothetical protein